MKHYRVETVELFLLVLVRYKSCLSQQEDFDLPTFAMPAAPRDSTDRIVDAIDFSVPTCKKTFFLFFLQVV